MGNKTSSPSSKFDCSMSHPQAETTEGSALPGAPTAVIWTENSARRCEICNSEFTLTRRRHHCRMCGIIVCHSCSSYKMPLPNSSNSAMVRICDRCRWSQCWLDKDTTKSIMQQAILIQTWEARVFGSKEDDSERRSSSHDPEMNTGRQQASDMTPISAAVPVDWRIGGDMSADSSEIYQGRVIYANGDTYEGDFFQNKRHGSGRYCYVDGSVYEGCFTNGRCDGEGNLTFPDGDRYEGNFKDGEMTGIGIMVSSDGSRYSGELLDGKFHGQGMFTYPNVDQYHGDFFEGKMQGRGVFIGSSGLRYCGGFVDGLAHGQGILSNPDEGHYEGCFEYGLVKGKGLLSRPDGASYQGTFLDCVPQGRGCASYPNGDSYSGDFLDGLRNGKGRYLFANGDIYEGDYHKGQRTGSGKYHFASGSSYEGYYLQGLRHGKGEFRFPINNSSYSGIFLEGKISRNGALTFPNGTSFVGHFKDEKPISGTLTAEDWQGAVEFIYSNDENGGECLEVSNSGLLSRSYKLSLVLHNGVKVEGCFLRDGILSRPLSDERVKHAALHASSVRHVKSEVDVADNKDKPSSQHQLSSNEDN